MRWFLVLLPLFLFGAINVSIDSAAAILINADTGAVLFEKNADERRYPASILKIATAVYAESLHPDWDAEFEAKQEAIGTISAAKKARANYRFPAHWIEVGGTHIDIKKGEKLKYRDLVTGMLMVSANDAANIIAYHLGKGSIENFVKGMNSYLKTLGCKHTTMENPHGIFMPKQKTTARDMALIARTFMKQPKLAAIVEKKAHEIPASNLSRARSIDTTVRLLKKGKHYYPGALGIKTGYTNASKSTLVAAAKRNGRTLIVVLLGAEDRDTLYADAKDLFDAGFNETRTTKKVASSNKHS